MPLDLSPIQSFLEGEMSDNITVREDPEGILDDTFDDVTMEYFAPSDDIQSVYDGPAMILPDNNQPAQADEGGNQILKTFYRMRVPLSAPELADNAEVTVTSSLRDSSMVGAVFLVISGTVSTFSVSKVYLLRRKTPLPPGGGMVVT